MTKDLPDAKKLDILLSFKAKGYNLVDTDDPAVMRMELGTGYSLLASINKTWLIEFNDGVETTKHNIESAKIPYINAKDARKLCKEYTAECKRVLGSGAGEHPPQDKSVLSKETEDLDEKSRLAREANEKKLAMMEEAEKVEDDLKKPNGTATSKPQSESSVIFVDRPAEYVEAPSPKKGEVNLMDVLTKICKNDLMQVFGNTGTGKTSLCTQLALDAIKKGKSVLYVDTEHNINDDQVASMKKAGVKYEYIKKFPKLCDEVKKLPKYGVVIIDSAGAPALAAYCKSNLGGQGNILKSFIAMSSDLKDYATEYDSLVVVINQPESSMNKGDDDILEPFGEKSRYYYKEILKTDYVKRGRTTEQTSLVLRAHRSRSMGINTHICTMEISDNGVKVIQ